MVPDRLWYTVQIVVPYRLCCYLLVAVGLQPRQLRDGIYIGSGPQYFLAVVLRRKERLRERGKEVVLTTARTGVVWEIRYKILHRIRKIICEKIQQKSQVENSAKSFLAKKSAKMRELSREQQRRPIG